MAFTHVKQRLSSDRQHILPPLPWDHIPNGNFRDYKIKLKNGGNNVRAAYLQLDTWHNDGLCISANQVLFANGGTTVIFDDLPINMCCWRGYIDIVNEIPLEGTESASVPWKCHF